MLRRTTPVQPSLASRSVINFTNRVRILHVGPPSVDDSPSRSSRYASLKDTPDMLLFGIRKSNWAVDECVVDMREVLRRIWQGLKAVWQRRLSKAKNMLDSLWELSLVTCVTPPAYAAKYCPFSVGILSSSGCPMTGNLLPM